MNHFFAYMARMKYIKRWGLMKNTQEENIQEHSLQVAMIAHALAVIKNTLFGGCADENRVAVMAMYHEASEVLTGDLPTPIKYYNADIKDSYKKIEAVAEAQIFSMLPQELQPAYRPYLLQETDAGERSIVKAADKICAYLKCVEETSAGNKEFEIAKKTLLASVTENAAPETIYFMEHFVPSFSLTLDEMGTVL